MGGVNLTNTPSGRIVSVSGEVDLLAVFQTIFHYKKTIIISIFLSGLFSIGYAFLSTPEFEVRTILRPAALNDLDALNQTGVYSLPPDEALIRVGAALGSYETRLEYFKGRPGLVQVFSKPGLTLEQSFDQFNRNSLKLVIPPAAKRVDQLTAFIGLELRYQQGIQGEQVLNEFVQHAIRMERKKISSELAVIVANRLDEIDGKLEAARGAHEADKAGRVAALLEADNLKRAELEDELTALRGLLKVRRADRVAHLEEAIGIARSLNLHKPTVPSLMGGLGNASGPVVVTEVYAPQHPLYFLGTKVLEAERHALLERVSDDFTDPQVALIGKKLMLLSANREVEILIARADGDVFLRGVEELRAERARLLHISTNMQALKLVTIDQSAVAPMQPVKPRRLLIIILGLMLGVIIGVIVVLVKVFAECQGQAALVHAGPHDA